jgi:leucyl/phenylalanyl-tRNA--protein transferase
MCYNPPVIEPEMLLTAYRRGIFPMAVDKRGRIGWFSPDLRAVIPLDARFHIPHGLRRVWKRCVIREKWEGEPPGEPKVVARGRGSAGASPSKTNFEITFDTDFETVIRECARRREGTWISPGIIDSYCRLHRLGHAHSMETRLDGKLVGGLYGVALGGAFFGESMYHRVTDASKVALVALVERLRAGGFVLLDTQWTTPHLQQFGTYEIPRHEYLWQLEHALKLKCQF